MRMFQPFFSVMENLKVLILPDCRPDSQRGPSGITLQWFGQTELIFQ